MVNSLSLLVKPGTSLDPEVCTLDQCPVLRSRKHCGSLTTAKLFFRCTDELRKFEVPSSWISGGRLEMEVIFVP